MTEKVGDKEDERKKREERSSELPFGKNIIVFIKCMDIYIYQYIETHPPKRILVYIYKHTYPQNTILFIHSNT